MLGLGIRKTYFTRRAEFYVGTGGETGRGLAVVAKKKKGCLHTPRGNRGGEPVGDLMLKGWNEGAGEGGKIVGGPGDVPSPIEEEPHPRPGGDVGVGGSAAVGKHSIS